MRNIIVTFAFCLPMLLAGCKENTEDIEKSFLNKTVMQLDLSTDYKWIVIIPGAGCHGCIQEGELFLKRNVNNPNILYVLTKFSSLKILQQKTGIRLKEHSNIYLDFNNLFDIPTNNTIYPCIAKLERGEVVSCSFQKPGNSAFKQIR